MQITDILSPKDAQRFNELGVIFESKEGELLTQLKQAMFNLVATTTDGSIPDGSIYSKNFKDSEFGRFYREYKRFQYLEKRREFKVSPSLSDFLWPSDEGNDQIEFRSPIPDFPPPGQLTIVSSNDKRKKGVGEYCLAACEGGTVRWLHESECVNNRSHVWTVHWFDLRGGGVVYFGDRLQRPVRNVYNYFVNTYIGGNVNGSGTQNIGTVSCR